MFAESLARFWLVVSAAPLLVKQTNREIYIVPKIGGVVKSAEIKQKA